MISKDKTYRTRDGREVRIYATDGCNETIHGAVRIDNEWVQFCWMEDGSCDGKGEFHYDLIEVKPRHKRTVWVNVYPEQVHGWFDTHQQAEEFARTSLFIEKTVGDTHYIQKVDKRIACIKVDLDFAEGEGL